MHPVPGPLLPDARLRAEIADRLLGGHASVTPDRAFDGIPEALAHVRPPGAAHTLWELLVHVSFTLTDILRFCVEADYRAPAWPEAYWPARRGPRPGEWEQALALYLAVRDRLVTMVENPATDLFAEFAHAPGYTMLREALLAAEHSAYHTGQVVSLRRTLGIWPPDEAASDGAVGGAAPEARTSEARTS